MSVRDREALRGFDLNLMVHELGHFIVAGQVAYAKQTFEGFGSLRPGRKEMQGTRSIAT